MIRSMFRKTKRLLNIVKISGQASKCRRSQRFDCCIISSRFTPRKYLSTSHEPITICHKDLFEYFKELHHIVNNQASSWPPIMREFLGGNPKRALDNLNAVLTEIHALDKSLQNLSEVERLIEETGCEADNEERDDLLVIAEDEKCGIMKDIKILNGSIVNSLISLLMNNHYVTSEIALEVSAGVGGQEAMLFAAEIFDMYHSFCVSYGQNFQIVDLDQSEIGGYQKASANISFTDLKFSKMFLNESGIHRVQRVPSTDRYGRIHTSTVSVAVLPVFDDQEIDISEKDLEITPVRKMNSPGGQHANKTSSAIRIKHKPTGKCVESSSSRSQLANRELALTLLRARLSQEKFDEQMDAITKTRRQQIKNNERSDKIRTYNFHKDRITDHRIGYSSSNISHFMNGGAVLYGLMEKLVQKIDADELDILVDSLLDERKVFMSERDAT